jgi:trigger factor
MMEHNHVPELVAEIRRGKALAQIVESAVVKDEAGADVELKTLLPDGTYGDPEAMAAADDASGAPAQVEPVDEGADDAASVVASADYLDK